MKTMQYEIVEGEWIERMIKTTCMQKGNKQNIEFGRGGGKQQMKSVMQWESYLMIGQWKKPPEIIEFDF